MRVSALCIALSLTSCGGADSPSPPRNLLLVSIDTLRADHVGCYGYARPTTPHMDALAARSHRFESYWSVLPTTLPAHAAMFTSLHPKLVGAPANGYPVSPAAHTLAERLRERGFATAAFVSAVPLHPRFGLDQGFDVYDHPPGEARRGDRTRERAEAWLAERGEQRFFAFVHLFDPHTWYDAPAAERALFDAPAGQQPPERIFLEHPERFTPELRAAVVAAYDAEIRFADAQLGALLAALERCGQADSTLVVVTSDHGETLDELIEPDAYAYDHGKVLHVRELRIPLIMHLPGSDEQLVHSYAASQLDLLPTLLELLGVPRDGLILGRSLVPLLSGSAFPTRPVFAERRAATIDDRSAALRHILAGEEFAVASERWLAVLGAARGDELFDLRTDPRGEMDVSAMHSGEMDRMRKLLEAWRATQEALGGQGAAADPADIDPSLLEALRALGYATD